MDTIRCSNPSSPEYRKTYEDLGSKEIWVPTEEFIKKGFRGTLWM